MPSALLPSTFLSGRQASHFSVSFFLLSSISLTWQLSVAAPRYGHLFLLPPPHEVPGSVVVLVSPHTSGNRVARRLGRGWAGAVRLGVSHRDLAVPVLNLRHTPSSTHPPVPCSCWRPEGLEKSEPRSILGWKISSPRSSWNPKQGPVELPTGKLRIQFRAAP